MMQKMQMIGAQEQMAEAVGSEGTDLDGGCCLHSDVFLSVSLQLDMRWDGM